MSNETREELERLAIDALETAQMLEELQTAGNVAGMDKGPARKRARKHYELAPDDSLWEAIDTIALEVYGTARIDPDGSTTLQTVTIVTGTGGPHIELELEPDTGSVEAIGYWGGEEVRRSRYGIAPTVAAELAEMLEVNR